MFRGSDAVVAAGTGALGFDSGDAELRLDCAEDSLPPRAKARSPHGATRTFLTSPHQRHDKGEGAPRHGSPLAARDKGQVQVQVHVHVNVHVYVYVYVYVCVYVYVYMYICIYVVYMYMLFCICIYVLVYM